MTYDNFKAVFAETMQQCESVLFAKSAEYSTAADKLHNFKVAAALAQCTPEKALAGMMIKHTVSVYDMINDLENGKEHDMERWSEKIIDNINYLILLKALLLERKYPQTPIEVGGKR